MTASRSPVALLLLLLTALLAPAGAGEATSKLAPISGIKEFATSYCASCHSDEKLKGGFDVSDLLKGATVALNPGGWHAVLEHLAARDMPPDTHKKRPAEKDYVAAETWVRGQLETNERIAADASPQPLRRLNRHEYDATIQAVFGLPGLTPGDDFPPDGELEGFTNIAEALTLSSVLVEQYMLAGRTVADRALIDGDTPPSTAQHFRKGDKDYAKDLRGYDPGGAMRGAWWIGDHLFAEVHLKPGYYTVSMKAIPRNLGGRPGFVPSFRFMFGDHVVNCQDATIREGEPMTVAFTTPVHQTGTTSLDLRWVNGFPDNNDLRARGLSPRRIPTPDPEAATLTRTFSQIGVWDELRGWEERNHKRAAGSPEAPYPFPYFEELALEVEGPLHPDGWPFSRFQRENAVAINAKDSAAIAHWLLPKLFRRPLAAGDAEHFADLVANSERLLAAPGAPEAANRYNEALRMAIQQTLMSPHFLFLIEPGATGRRLGEHELATRLSYFLCGGPPDAELAALADTGRLRASMGSQARRLLGDPRSRAFTDRFTNEWLGLARLSSIMPEPSLYARFDKPGLLRADMAEEPRAMMAYLLNGNLSLFDLLDCNYAFINDRLADHYHLPSLWSTTPLVRAGFAPVTGGTLRRVTLPTDRSGGLVTMAGCLALTSENTRTSMVRRGAWILEKVFNRRPPPPPPSVKGVLPESSEANTAVEQFLKHSTASSCAGCHSRFDPLGKALEHYDVIGEWRDREELWTDPGSPVRSPSAMRQRFKLEQWAPFPRFPIDDSFTIGGFSGKGDADLKKWLMANRERFARGFGERLLSYALGRRHLLRDENDLERIVKAAVKDNFRFQDLIIGLVESPIFQVH